MIKTRNFVTFYKFLIHLGMHHTQSYDESLEKIPIPILAITAFQNDLIDPLDLIIAIKMAANDFNDGHKETKN
jgi:hypothetical protein